MECTGCSAVFEFLDGGDIEWDGARRHWQYEHLVCTKCEELRSIPYFYDEAPQAFVPQPSPPRCNKSSCRRVLRPWPGSITPETFDGPCPKCSAPLVECGMAMLWD